MYPVVKLLVIPNDIIYYGYIPCWKSYVIFFCITVAVKLNKLKNCEW